MHPLTRTLSLSLALAAVDARSFAAAGAQSVTDTGPHTADFGQPEINLEYDDALVAAIEQRMRALGAGRPTLTILRLDDAGQPHTRIDLFLGSDQQLTRADVLALTDPFDFGETTSTDDEPAGARQDWRTVILPQPLMPFTEPVAATFDLDADCLIQFRPAPLGVSALAISCNQSWSLNWDGTLSTGWVSPLYFTSVDAITVAAQARRDTNGNPNLYLDRWNGSYWPLIASSTSGNQMDRVRHHSSTCTASNYRVRVYMANGGPVSLLGVTFKAN